MSEFEESSKKESEGKKGTKVTPQKAITLVPERDAERNIGKLSRGNARLKQRKAEKTQKETEKMKETKPPTGRQDPKRPEPLASPRA